MTAAEYNHCVDEFADSLYRFVFKNLKDEERARDVVQDTFEKVWLKAAIVDMAKAKAYFFTTAYHTMIDVIRKDKFSARLDDINEVDHTYHHQYSDIKKVLNDALQKLNEVQRSVLLLRDYEGYSYEEIGEITGLNPSQVKVYIFRARVFLKDYLGSLHKVI